MSQKVRNQLQYQPAWECLSVRDKELETQIKKKTQDLGDRLLKKGKCLVMGDLWPPSVFVSGNEYEVRFDRLGVCTFWPTTSGHRTFCCTLLDAGAC